MVVLSQHAEEAYAFQLLEHGTDGLAYLLKHRVGDLDELLRSLKEVAAGRSVIYCRAAACPAGPPGGLAGWSAVEKRTNAIFSKLGLADEPQVHRWVAAVLALLREAGY